MKKFICFLFIAIFSMTLISCGTNNESTSSSEKSLYKNITIEESKNLIDSNKVDLILDVRDEKQFKEGHLPNSTLIPYKDFEKNLSQIADFKNKPILIYCNSGKKSADAIKILEKNGFTNIYHMVDGINKWTYEIEK